MEAVQRLVQTMSLSRWPCPTVEDAGQFLVAAHCSWREMAANDRGPVVPLVCIGFCPSFLIALRLAFACCRHCAVQFWIACWFPIVFGLEEVAYPSGKIAKGNYGSDNTNKEGGNRYSE